MKITILADASHCPETKRGGYGYWIASARGKKGGSGPFKDIVQNSTMAEIMAIVNAIYSGIKLQLIEKKDELLIQSDCESAIFALLRKRTINSNERHIVDYMTKLVRKFELEVTYLHVRAHTRNTGNRSLAQAHCDRLARKEMRKARKAHLECEKELSSQS